MTVIPGQYVPVAALAVLGSGTIRIPGCESVPEAIIKLPYPGMLLELLVENYAVVERVRVRFHPGLNLLTGETGSGKSIVVDALGLLFGGRASADMIRSGQDRARVSGRFDAPERASKVLAQAGFEAEQGEMLLEREILSNGKSRVYVN